VLFQHDKKHLYGTDYIYVGADHNRTIPPMYVGYAIHNSSSITFDKSLSGTKPCNGSSIYIIPSPNPPYAVYGADYWGTPGCGSVMSVDASGALSEVIQNFEYLNDSGVHGMSFSPGSQVLYSADTLGNYLWTHTIDAATGKLGQVLGMAEGPSPKAHPRHVVTHPSGKAIYAVMEGSSEVAWYKVDSATNIPTMQEPLYSLLPVGTNGSNYWGDTLALSASAKYLWATTRAKDDGIPGYVAVYELNSDGAIVKENFLKETTTSGGVANALQPAEFSDRYVALTDNEIGFVEIWEMIEDGNDAEVIARIDLADQGNARYASGCCANAVWLN
jgi:carboxy-cis,cis-muconate cyclase